MKKAERYSIVLDRFRREMPVAETELEFASPFQLLVAVILSAQCTDKRVNLITPALFEAYPTAEAMAEATPDDIFDYIRSCSYPNNKAKALAGMARRLLSDFGGEVPATMDELLTLPGVGRKTANVVLSVVYDRPAMAAMCARRGVPTAAPASLPMCAVMPCVPRRRETASKNH